MDLCNGKEVKALLSRHGFHFARRLGQNFLINGEIPERIARLSGIDSEYGVLEVGPGIGTLTVRLAGLAEKVTAVEVDEALLPVLDETLAGFDNCEIVNGDILKINVKKLVREKMPGLKYAACANLPYYITTQIVSELLQADVFDTVTVMMQREVARRVCAKEGTPDYGAFTLFVKYYTEPEILFDVSPDCFMPQPKVYSSVVKLTRHSQPPENIENKKAFFALVKSAFAHRRKTLVNAVYSMFGQNIEMILKTKTGSEFIQIKGVAKEEIAGIIESCGFDSMVRGEMLSFDDFALLSNAMKEILA